MKVSDTIISFGNLRIKLEINNNDTRRKNGFKGGRGDEPKERKLNHWMDHWAAGMVDVQITRFLVVSVSKEDPETGKNVHERCALSVFDIHKLKNALLNIVDYLYDEKNFIETVDPDTGGRKLTLANKNGQERVQAISGGQILFVPTVAYTKVDDTYTPGVRIIVNNKEHRVTLDRNRFIGVADTLNSFDIITSSHTLLTTVLTAAAVNKHVASSLDVKES